MKVSEHGFETLDDLRRTRKGIMKGDKKIIETAYVVSNNAHAMAKVMGQTLSGQRFDKTTIPKRTVKVRVSES